MNVATQRRSPAGARGPTCLPTNALVTRRSHWRPAAGCGAAQGFYVRARLSRASARRDTGSAAARRSFRISGSGSF